MVTFVQDVAQWDTNAGNKSVAITPAVNGLLVVVFGEAGQAVTGTIADEQGGTYTLISDILRAGSGQYRALAIRDSLVSSAVAHTVTMTAGGVNTGGGLTVQEWSGMTKTGATASKQTPGEQNNQAAGGTPAPAFGAAVDTNNPVIAFMGNGANPAGMTPPTDWTERRDIGFGTPSASVYTATRDSGFTGTTVTWGSSSATTFCAAVVELDASGGLTDADAEVSWIELEVPFAPADAEVSHSEFEVIDPANAEVSFAELEVQLTPADAEVSWAEVEFPFASANAEVSHSEFEVTFADANAEVSWAEVEVPNVGEIIVTAGRRNRTSRYWRSHQGGGPA